MKSHRMFRSDSHRLLFACLLVLALQLTAVPPAIDAAVEDRLVKNRPNIVLIVSDDQGYHDLGCFGNQEIRTPHLDRLAREGVKLTNFYVAWPACTPSRASLLTGRYPQRNGLYDMIRNDIADTGKKISPLDYPYTPERILGLDTREYTVADFLRKAGYRNGVFGKWDSGQLKRYLPLQRGFHEFYGFVNTGIDYYTHERYGVPSMYRNNQPTTEDRGDYCTHLFAREALRFVRKHAGRPFFLYLPFNAPHGASHLDPRIRGAAQAPAEYKKLYPQYADTLQQGTRYGKPAQVPSRSKRRLEYLAAVTCMDDAIGQLLNALDEKGIADNTLVIFFSDNGGSHEADNSPLRGHKAQLWEGGVRVPCIVRFPGRIRPGRVCDQFLSSLEVLPTILAAARIPLPTDITFDGFSMLPALEEMTNARVRTEMVWQRRGDRAIRAGQWKWVSHANGAGGLYHLENDPGEQTDLTKQQADKLNEIRLRFARWKQEMIDAPPRRPFRDY